MPKATSAIKQFKELKPPIFKGTTDPLEAEVWITQVENIFRAMECPEEQKVVLATFVLEGEANM